MNRLHDGYFGASVLRLVSEKDSVEEAQNRYTEKNDHDVLESEGETTTGASISGTVQQKAHDQEHNHSTRYGSH